MRIVMQALVITVLAGCTIQYTPQPSPEERLAIPAFKPGLPVAIVNKTAAREVLLSVGPYDVRADFRQYADSAVQLLRRELERLQGVVQESAPREIGLDFTDIRIQRSAGSFRSVINFTVTTGDGYLRGLEASDASWNFQQAIDGAIVDAVKAILANERVRQYLSE